jgi:hypothetical protein
MKGEERRRTYGWKFRAGIVTCWFFFLRDEDDKDCGGEEGGESSCIGSIESSLESSESVVEMLVSISANMFADFLGVAFDEFGDMPSESKSPFRLFTL